MVLIVDGLVNIVQPRQDGFEVQVVLVLQVFVSDAPATGALAAAAAPALETIQSMFESFSSTLRAGKKATFASVKAAQEKDDPSPFLNWHVVWMGIEG